MGERWKFLLFKLENKLVALAGEIRKHVCCESQASQYQQHFPLVHTHATPFRLWFKVHVLSRQFWVSASTVQSAVCQRLGITQTRNLCHSVAFNAASTLKKESVAYLSSSSSRFPNKSIWQRILSLAARLCGNPLVTAVSSDLLSCSTKCACVQGCVRRCGGDTTKSGK